MLDNTKEATAIGAQPASIDPSVSVSNGADSSSDTPNPPVAENLEKAEGKTINPAEAVSPAEKVPLAGAVPPAQKVNLVADQTAHSKTSTVPSIIKYVPGAISIILGIVMLITQTPDVSIKFGADFYTESYRAIADVAIIAKYGFGFLLIAFGIESLCRSLVSGKNEK